MDRAARPLLIAIAGTFSLWANSTADLPPTVRDHADQVAAGFNRISSAGLGSAEAAKLRKAAVEAYRNNELRDAEGYYRAGSLLSVSSEERELLMAHDLSLAALSKGFTPAIRVLRESQDRLLEILDVDPASLPEIGHYRVPAPLYKGMPTPAVPTMTVQAEAPAVTSTE